LRSPDDVLGCAEVPNAEEVGCNGIEDEVGCSGVARVGCSGALIGGAEGSTGAANPVGGGGRGL
jgi:hypothetical protein